MRDDEGLDLRAHRAPTRFFRTQSPDFTSSFSRGDRQLPPVGDELVAAGDRVEPARQCSADPST